MIKSEAYFRAECDHDGCEASLPDPDEHEASGWPLNSVKDALGEERGDRDETWTVVGEHTFCPRHKPGNAECTACDGRGHFRTELPEPIINGRRWDFASCPICDGEGYLLAPESHNSGSERIEP